MRHKEFGRLLNYYLNENQRSASWLAQKIGDIPRNVERWADNTGRRPGSYYKVVLIAEAFKLNIFDCNDLLSAAGYQLLEDLPAPEREENQEVHDAIINIKDRLAQTIENTTNPRFLEPTSSPVNTNETNLHLKEIKAGVSHLIQQHEQINNKITTFARDDEAQQSLQTPQQDLQLPIARPFVGRGEVVRKVAEQLQPGTAVTLWGAGGQGKTSIAWKVLNDLRSSGELSKRFPDGTILHNFASQPDLEAAITHIAKSLNEELAGNPIGACLRALSGKQALLILESTEEADEETLRTLYALANECGLLITTRRQTDAPDKNYLHQIGQLLLQEAIQLLEEIISTNGNVPSNAARLCEMIDSQPLAVRVAANYLAETGETIDEYMEWLEDDTVGALSSDTFMNRMLQHTISQVPDDARTMLELISCLAFAPFQENVVTNVLRWNRTRYKRMRKRLLDYGLLRPIGTMKLQITHALIYQYARTLNIYQSNLIDILVDYYVQKADKNSNDTWLTLETTEGEHVHILSVLQKCEELHHWTAANRLFIASAVGKDCYFGKLAFSTQHIAAFQIGVSVANALGEEDKEEERIAQLGHLCLYYGQLEEGVIYLEKALDSATKKQDQELELSLLLVLGSAYMNLGAKKVFDIYNRALRIAQEHNDRKILIDCRINMAKAYVQLKQENNAVTQYEYAISIAHETQERDKELSLLGSLGTLHHRLGHEGDAITAFEEQLKIAQAAGDLKETLTALELLADAYHSWNRVDKAVDTYQQLYIAAEKIDDKFKMSFSLQRIADLYVHNQLIDKAIEYYEQADSIDEFKFLNTLLKLSDIHYQHGDFAKAEHYQERAYRSVMQMKQEHEKSLRNAPIAQSITKQDKNFPSSDVIYTLIGVNNWGEKIYLIVKLPYKLYLSMKTMTERGIIFEPRHYGVIVAAGRGELDTRVECAMKLIYNCSSDGMGNEREIKQNPKSGEDYRNRGYTYLLDKNYDAAKSDLKQAIQLEPDNAESYAHYGQLLYDLEQYQKSCEYYEQAIKLDSEVASYFSGRGRCWYELHQFSTAKTDFECAITLNPKEPWYHSWLGNSLVQIRDWQAAMKAYNDAIQLLPWQDYFYRMRSIVHLEQMDYIKARWDLERAVEITPENKWIYERLTILELAQSQYQSAIHAVEKATELNSEDNNIHYWIHYWRGLAYLGVGQWELTLLDLETLNDNTSNSVEIAYSQFWLGVVDILQERPIDAGEKWAKVHKLIPQSPDEDQGMTILALLALLDRKADARALLGDLLSTRYGLLSNKLLYLRLLAHLFPNRKDIEEISSWFEEKIISRYCKGNPVS